MKKQVFLYGHNLEVMVRQEPALLGKYCAVVYYLGYQEPYTFEHNENEEIAIQKAAFKLISSFPFDSLENLGFEKN